MLLKLSGRLLDDDTLQQVADAWRDVPEGGTWILVHGAGPQLDVALKAIDPEPRRVEGLRVTGKAAAKVVAQTMDAIGAEVTARLNRLGAGAFHVAASEQRLQAAVKDPRLGRVGTPTGFDAAGLGPGLHVVTPVGWDAEGPLNVNADEGALAVAEALPQQRFVLATEVDGVLDAHGDLIHVLSLRDAQRLLDDGTADGGMRPKLRAAMEALTAGVDEVLIGPPSCAWKTGGTRLARLRATA